MLLISRNKEKVMVYIWVMMRSPLFYGFLQTAANPRKVIRIIKYYCSSRDFKTSNQKCKFRFSLSRNGRMYRFSTVMWKLGWDSRALNDGFLDYYRKKKSVNVPLELQKYIEY
jgi:hypothetical protein